MKTPASDNSLGRWMAGFGVLVLLGAWAIALGFVREDRRGEIDRANNAAKGFANILEEHIAGTLSEIESSLATLKRDRESGADLGDMSRLLRSAAASQPELYNLISIIDAEGHVVATDQPTFSPTFSGDRPFFEFHRSNDSPAMRIGTPTLGRVTGKWYLPMSMRLDNAAGQFGGVLLASVNPHYFSALFRNANLGRDSLIYLADYDGTVYSAMEGGRERSLDLSLPKQRVAEILAAEAPTTGPSALDGKQRIRNLNRIRERRLFVSVGIGMDEWLRPWRRRATGLLATQAVLTVLAAVGARRLWRAMADNARSERKLRLFMEAIDNSSDAIGMATPEGIHFYQNKAYDQLFGAVGARPVETLFADREAGRQISEAIMAGGTWTGEVAMKSAAGTHLDILLRAYAAKDEKGRVLVLVGLHTDVTERNRAAAEDAKLREQLQQAQKMESVGRLAGGVAHDFNNMLAVILGNVEMALHETPPERPPFPELLEIRKAAERSTDLTKQLLSFARKQATAPKPIDLNETVAGMLRMLQRLIGENVKLVWRPGRCLWTVKMDPSQLDQILTNLCVNSRDAIQDVGEIAIETANVRVDEKTAAAWQDAQPGEYVRLEVVDSGGGMDPETLAHAFEPFFTTKAEGKGTGLGLATIYGAVRQNGGFVRIRSAPGQGTSIGIHLPRHAAGMPKATAAAPAPAIRRGKETVLLVEDEESIMNLAVSILRHLGYAVISAQTPGDALRLADAHPGAIHLLLTDVVMPDMNGPELARRLSARHPGIKCLFMSGYALDMIDSHGVLEEGVCFVQKPFTLRTLADKLREALGNENGAPAAGAPDQDGCAAPSAQRP